MSKEKIPEEFTNEKIELLPVRSKVNGERKGPSSTRSINGHLMSNNNCYDDISDDADVESEFTANEEEDLDEKSPFILPSPLTDSDEPISEGKEICDSEMGGRYSPQSSSDGDVETDTNIDLSSQKAKLNGSRFNSINSSIGSLEEDNGTHTDDNTEETKIGSPHSNNNIDAADTRQFNIPPNIHTGFNHRGGAAVSSASSANCSCDHNVPSLLDAEQDPTRQWTLEYHSTSIPPSVQQPGSMHTPDSFTANTCRCCLDNQSHILPPTQSHQGSCCGSLTHTPVPFSHYHQNIPHSMTRSHNTSKYQSGSYEPPWDLVYPSLSQLGMVQPHANHSPYQHGLNMPTSMAHSNISAHNSTSNNMSPSASHQSHYRASSSLRKGGSGLSPNKFSDTHRYPGESGTGGGGNMGATNTLATTASHSYETPWDLGDSSRVLAYWQSRQSTRKLHDTIGSSATLGDRKPKKPGRHVPPPSSPPPPPPEVLRRPLLHYDGAALAQANLVQQLPQKKPGRRRFCNWRCIGIFLIFSIVVLAGCVAAFTYLLVEKDNSTGTALQGASKQTGPVTDGNIGDRHRSDIPPHDFVRVRFYIAKSQFYKFNLSINDDAYIGVYGRRSLQPTHTQYDLVETLSGEKIAASVKAASRQRVKRSGYSDVTPQSAATQEVNTAFSSYLDEGHWYLSLYNDDSKSQVVRFTLGRQEKMTTDCPNDCYGKGECREGTCHCYLGYTGVECSQYACPVLCSGNGVYEEGVCKCYNNWKGAECSIQAHHCKECIHGRCIDGECSCQVGWKGEDCSEVDCEVPNCSGHGVCQSGKCYCEMGFRGIDCSIDEMGSFTMACSNDCSGHGTFDLHLQTCSCETGWTGRNCEELQCSVDCIYGNCSNGQCVCEDRWGGIMCNERLCDDRCSLHGQCNNGTCTCLPGWNGRHCTLEGCQNSCNAHGECMRFGGIYSCSCTAGWKGAACEVATETDCSDGQDNDNDNLHDCLDPDCCSQTVCKTAAFCQLSPDPTKILFSQPRLSSTASFFDSKKFLISETADENSVQLVGDVKFFDEHRVSVITGSVVLRDGSPALGTRVEIAEQRQAGFSLTRENGTFDMMVNGGGAITVRFVRGSSLPANVTVILPWNKIIVLDPVTLLQANDEPIAQPTCDAGHDRYKLYPIVLPTWQHSQLKSCPGRSVIIPESQVIQESIWLPGTDVHLLYRSSDGEGYKSTILIQLTPRQIPDTLLLVHLRVSVEGLLHTELFEADPNLTYRYSWQRKNVYQQEVYGIVTAHVMVGYQYTGCEKIYWDRQATTLTGYLGGDLSLSSRSVAIGWSLDIQHFYHHQEGILHKGDGTNIYLKEKPQLLHTVLGNGSRRDSDCASCNGNAKSKQLLAPVAVASDLDGAVYVADSNVIRRLSPSMNSVTSILKLSSASTSYRYYMTVSPKDGMLYLTDFHNRQILRVTSTDPQSLPQDISTNFEIIAGTGVMCVRGSGTRCGDGGSARDATLSSPKGIAVNKLGEVYFVDDTTVRKIYLNGTIETVIGSQDLPGQYVAMPCGRAADLYEVFLGWPTSIAFSPVDGTLHILDSATNLILKLTPENKVAIVAGRPSHCPQVVYKNKGLGLLGDDYLQSLQARRSNLVAVKSMTFAPNGDLYLVESDEQKINRVRVISTDGYISHYAGGKPSCNCQMPGCSCWDPSEVTAAKALLNNPSSVTVTPDGVLFIADMGNLRVHSVLSTLPKAVGRHYEVVSPEDGQIYRFDKNGFHVRTTDIMTGGILYNFTMVPPNRISGSIVSVSGKGGQTLHFSRGEDGRVRNITLNNRMLAKIETHASGTLRSYTGPDSHKVSFTYSAISGLLTNKWTSKGEVYFYNYDATGRLSDVTLPTGEVTKLQASVDSKGARILLTRNAAEAGTATYNGNSLLLMHGMKSADVTYSNDGSVVVEYPSGLVVTLEMGTAPSLSEESPTALKRKIISSENGPVHRLEWRYYLRRQNIPQLGRKLRVSPSLSPAPESSVHAYNKKDLMVNGKNLLSFEYMEDIGLDQDGINVMQGLEIVKDKDGNNLMHVMYNGAGQPLLLSVYGNTVDLDRVNLTYNQAGQLIHWNQGKYYEKRTYDSAGRLEIVRRSPQSAVKYTYSSPSSMPTGIVLASGVKYQLVYDTLGNLIDVVTPGGQVHSFHVSMNIGFVRHTYAMSGRLYIEDVSSLGQMFRRVYPSDYRRVYQRYTSDGRLRDIMYDTALIEYSYSSVTRSLTDIFLTSDFYDAHHSYTTNGSLYTEHMLSVASKLSHRQFADIQLSYKYNKFLRIVNITGAVMDGSRNLPIKREFSYAEETGLVDGIGDFSVMRTIIVKKPKTIISDSTARIIRMYDFTNLPTVTELRVGGTLIHQSTVVYDSMQRVKEWITKMGTYRQHMEYTYNADSNVVKVASLKSVESWIYTYNKQGSVVKVQHDSTEYPLTLDKYERVLSYRGDNYKYDVDGYLVSNNDVKYEFNSLGHLTHVLEDGKMDVMYFYDAIGRLMTRQNNYGSSIQFFYANVMNPSQLTEVYNATSHSLYSLIYDDRGQLLAIDNKLAGERYYIMCDHSGSPVAAYDSTGKLLKRISYTLFGQVIEDTNPDLNLFIGYQAGFYDPVTKLNHLSERWYHTELGTYMDGNLEGIFDRMKSFIANPQLINGYRNSHPINLHINHGKPKYMDDIESWLKALGYDMDVLAPNMTFEGRLSHDSPLLPSEKALLPLISAFQCAYQQEMNNFLQLSLVPRSKLVSSIHSDTFGRTSFSPAGSLFSQGIVASVSAGRLATHVYGNPPSQETLLATRVLNDSLVLGLNFTYGGKVIHHLVKPDLSSLDDDLQTLGTQLSANLFLENGVKVRLRKVVVTDPESKVDIEQGELVVSGNTTEIWLRYGTSVEKERQRILRGASESILQSVWLQEIQKVVDGRRSSYPWTSAEINELRNKGHVKGYNYTLVRSSRLYPELAYSPTNIRLTKILPL